MIISGNRSQVRSCCILVRPLLCPKDMLECVQSEARCFLRLLPDYASGAAFKIPRFCDTELLERLQSSLRCSRMPPTMLASIAGSPDQSFATLQMHQSRTREVVLMPVMQRILFARLHLCTITLERSSMKDETRLDGIQSRK
jgi:hypothetical protein